MKVQARVIILALLAFAAPALAIEQPDDVTAAMSQAQLSQYQHLTNELRCLVCQNQSLADSNADLALDLRRKVGEQVLAGQTDAAIIDYFVARYGEFVHYQPSFSATNALLWLAPWLFIIFGCVIAWRSFRSTRGGHAVRK